jgi:hypothetical protein
MAPRVVTRTAVEVNGDVAPPGRGAAELSLSRTPVQFPYITTKETYGAGHGVVGVDLLVVSL